MQHRIVIAGDTAGRFVRVGRDGFRVASGRDAINRASTTARPIVPHPTIIGIIIVTFFSQIPAFRMIKTYRSKSRLKTLELLDIIIFEASQRL